MNFSAWAIRKPIPSILLFILITVAGLVSFKMLSIQNFPDIDFPAVSVTASLPGATPGFGIPLGMPTTTTTFGLDPAALWLMGFGLPAALLAAGLGTPARRQRQWIFGLALTLIGTLVSDLLYMVVDPRIRL